VIVIYDGCHRKGMSMKLSHKLSNVFNMSSESSPSLTPIAFLVPVVAGIGSAAVAAAPAVAVAAGAAYATNYAAKKGAQHGQGGRVLRSLMMAKINADDVHAKSLQDLIALANF